MLYRLLIVFLLLVVSENILATESKANQFTKSTNLVPDLSYFDSKNATFRTYTSENVNLVYYKFENKRKFNTIKIENNEAVYLFLNSIFIGKYPNNSFLNLNNYRNLLKESNTLAIWVENNFDESFQLEEVIQLVEAKTKVINQQQGYKPLDIIKRRNKSFYFLYFIVFIGVISLLKPFIFNESIFNRLLSFKLSELQVKFNPLNWLFLLLLLINSSVLTAFLFRFKLLQSYLGEFEIVNFLQISVFIFTIYILKYIILYIFSLLFLEENEFSKVYYAEFMVFNFIFIIIIASVLFLGLLNLNLNEDFIIQLGKYLIVIFISLRTIRLFFLLTNQFNFQILQVFSYLCVLELFPWLILLNTLFK